MEFFFSVRPYVPFVYNNGLRKFSPDDQPSRPCPSDWRPTAPGDRRRRDRPARTRIFPSPGPRLTDSSRDSEGGRGGGRRGEHYRPVNRQVRTALGSTAGRSPPMGLRFGLQNSSESGVLSQFDRHISRAPKHAVSGMTAKPDLTGRQSSQNFPPKMRLVS